MAKVRVGLVQMALKAPTSAPVGEIRDAMNDAHVARVREAAAQGVQVPDDVDALLVADIDVEVARAARDTWRFDEHRCPDMYRALVD